MRKKGHKARSNLKMSSIILTSFSIPSNVDRYELNSTIGLQWLRIMMTGRVLRIWRPWLWIMMTGEVLGTWLPWLWIVEVRVLSSIFTRKSIRLLSRNPQASQFGRDSNGLRLVRLAI